MLDGGYGLGREKLGFDSGNGKVVSEVVLHLIEVDAFEVASGHDPGGKGQRGAVLEKIEQVVLAGEDHGQKGFGVGLELAEGVQFGEHFEPQKAGLSMMSTGWIFLLTSS